MTEARARTGILGGTFNPIHLGHLRAAEEVVEALGLEQMIFVPSADPPHKTHQPSDPIAPAAKRLEWVEMAIRDNPRFEADRIEIERAGPSYSLDTLKAIGQRIAPERPVFTIGQDAFVEIDTWKKPEEIFEIAHFAVITRPPVALLSLADWMPKCIRGDMEPNQNGLFAQHKRADTWIRLLDITALDISSSDIRRRIRDRRSIRYLLPPAVAETIDKSEVYSNVDGET